MYNWIIVLDYDVIDNWMINGELCTKGVHPKAKLLFLCVIIQCGSLQSLCPVFRENPRNPPLRTKFPGPLIILARIEILADKIILILISTISLDLPRFSVQWKFQNPKMEVPYHIRQYFMGIVPQALWYVPPINRFLSHGH